jgi:aspartokinase/homoserine dehydrogenase 1
MKVVKFGGSSLGDAKRIKIAAEIIRSDKTSRFVVLSAMQGVTNQLIEAALLASKGELLYKTIFESLKQLHLDTINQLVTNNESFTLKILIPMFEELEEILHGIELLQDCTPRTKDLVMSFGERLSCQIVSFYLSSIYDSVEYIDSRDIIKTDENFSSAAVLFEESNTLIVNRLANLSRTYIITGFIGSTLKGITTTFGRNGSDYTASIIGSALSVDSVEIWTDVDGVLSADPRIVPNAYVIPELSMEEASEMAYFGAKVIHPYTLHPLIEKKIPCWIKNTFNPSFSGSVIKDNCINHEPGTITAIASIDNVSSLNIIGSGLIGLPGMTSKIFLVFAKLGINIIMITQASSEHSLCVLCRTEDAHRAREQMETDLKESFQSHYLREIEIRDNLEIVAVIGDKMKGTPGISGRLFSALGNNKINIQAIAQGSSERNISFVIDSSDKKLAINAVHETFLRPKDIP